MTDFIDNPRSPGRTPVALRCGDFEGICRENPCDRVRLLGSFWPNSASSFESHVVKGFKECLPARDFEPWISQLCEFYAELVMEAAGGGFEWVARVLSSAETAPDESRPQHLLEEMVCRRSGARSVTKLFFKTETRPPMRFVERLSGREALHGRVRYASADLFVRPAQLGGRVLLLDDILNTGASIRVYAAALKTHAGAREVHCVNLAATRFAGGRDSLGMLKLDTSGIERRPGLGQVWLDGGGLFTTHKIARIS